MTGGGEAAVGVYPALACRGNTGAVIHHRDILTAKSRLQSGC